MVKFPFDATLPWNVRLVSALLRGTYDQFEVKVIPHRGLSEMGSLVESWQYASFLTKSWERVERQISELGYIIIRDDIRRTLHTQISQARVVLGHLGCTVDFHSTRRPGNFLVLRQIFLQFSQPLTDILKLTQHLINADNGITPDFMENCLMFISKEHPEARPVLHNNMFHICLPGTARPMFFNRSAPGDIELHPTNDIPYGNIPWEWAVGRNLHTEPSIWSACGNDFDKLCQSTNSMGLPLSDFRLRAPFERIKQVLRNTLYCETLSKLSPARRHTEEEELAMLLRGSMDEDRYICMNSWPRIVIDEFQAEGKIKRVEFV